MKQEGREKEQIRVEMGQVKNQRGETMDREEGKREKTNKSDEQDKTQDSVQNGEKREEREQCEKRGTGPTRGARVERRARR